MVVKIYISGISGNKEVKKRQQRVMMILDSKNVEYEIIDITEPGKELEKEFMQTNSNARTNKYPLPPQIFNEDDYCGPSTDKDAGVVPSDSLPERTTLESENKELDESKPTEVDSAAKTITSDEGEHAEDSGDKNEEKSDDQEKEE
ncbi:PREDICTED: SH3 domain-binding glutamic acid-rich protein homolog isoform X3 [Dinoponera quadriceps]|uniref:SH3 domain-binding glutamic acid-rich protein homolog isoform X3 n=1 Tax=Dinoponera quadriceps TaxID=609295 RepID=A0A6P3XJI1_DINQU|nr:PREDICTED: SH3 domain-binding glutamic acid-rich protein homolog isoform X3 [Dinoponera quadriceps]